MADTTWGDAGVDFNGRVSLSGCVLENAGGPSEGVVLANHTNSGAGADALWRFNEASYDGTAGEVLDAVGSNPGQAMNGAQTAATGMDRSVEIIGGASHYVRYPYSSLFQSQYTGAVAAWVYYDGDVQYVFCRTNTAAYWGIMLQVLNSAHPTHAGYPVLFLVRSGVSRPLVHSAPLETGWNYLVGRWTSTAQYVDSYSPSGAAHNSMASSGGLRFGNAYSTVGAGVGTGYGSARVDELAIYNTEQAQSVFDALAYFYKSAAQKSGTQPYVDLSETGLAGQVPSAISWTAETGASYGKVKAVYLLDAVAGWTAVGGADPTSPITGLSAYALGADSCLRFELEPKADTIQSGTPTLQGVTLTHATGRANLGLGNILGRRLIGGLQ